MASLTETMISNKYFDNLTIDNNNNNNNTDYYDSLYLCVEKEQNTPIIKGFNCFLFNSFQSADKYYKNMEHNIGDKRHTMIPICKYVPYYFHHYILNYKLKKLYWNNNISIYRYFGFNQK